MSERRRPLVVHVITRLIVGGAQLSVLGLCEGLRDEFDMCIVAGPQTGAEGSLHRRAADLAPLTIVAALRREPSLRWDPVVVPALRRVLRRLDADIVHTHSSKAGISGRFAAAPSRARVVHTIHGWGHTPADAPWRRGAFIALERAAARRCDALVAVSRDNREEGLALSIGRPELYHVIPEVVNLEPLDRDFQASRVRARAALGLKADEEVVGWVGRFVEQKDPETLARALTMLLQAAPERRAVLIGDGPSRADVEAVLRASGVSERVVLTGIVPSARELMPAFDVLIHPSRWEGQPRVIQEALAERIPVVSAHASGIRELIRDRSTGFVVGSRAPEEMAGAVTTILESPSLRAPIDDSELAQLRAMHGQTAALERHRVLYDRLLAGRG